MYVWTEKYRPTTVDDYVFVDENHRAQIKNWIKAKNIPHILFSGSPGVGKTTMAKILIKALEIEPGDVLEINASRTNGVDDVRDKIVNFAGTMPWGAFKVVLLDEADYLSHNAQGAMRGVMEEFIDNCRFILTCNKPNKIMDALHSRCQSMHIEKLDKLTFTERAATILLEENIEFDLDVLDSYILATYPDMRKCINALQQNSQDNKLHSSTQNIDSTQDYLVQAVELMKAGKITDARRLIVANATVGDIDGLFRWMYDNLELWSKSQAGQDEAIKIIRDGLVNHALVADVEINLAATMVELCSIEE